MFPCVTPAHLSMPMKLLLGLLMSCALLAATAAGASHDSNNGGLVSQWLQLVKQTAQLPTRQKLRRINRFFNQRIRFQLDTDTWQTPDYWATPRETLIREAGDCEDFTIAKYISLLESGVDAGKLRLVYVNALSGLPQSALQQAHMVLAYYPESTAEPLILDNLTSEIRPASRRPDLIPVFSFNSEGLWVQDGKVASLPGPYLSNWQAVMKRMAQEGLYRTVPVME